MSKQKDKTEIVFHSIKRSGGTVIDEEDFENETLGELSEIIWRNYGIYCYTISRNTGTRIVFSSKMEIAFYILYYSLGIEDIPKEVIANMVKTEESAEVLFKNRNLFKEDFITMIESLFKEYSKKVIDQTPLWEMDPCGSCSVKDKKKDS